MSKLAGTGGEEINHLREKDARCSFLFQDKWISYGAGKTALASDVDSFSCQDETRVVNFY